MPAGVACVYRFEKTGPKYCYALLVEHPTTNVSFQPFYFYFYIFITHMALLREPW